MNPVPSSPRIELAPLHGVTNRVFRKAYLGHFQGIDSILAPFILSVRVDRMKESHFKDLQPDPEISIPLVPQILGNDPEGFVATAGILAEMGYREVNWNLGCPYPMVAKKGRGSGLLPHPDRIADFLDAVVPRLAIPLSVKLRLGRDDPAEILDLMPLLDTYPLSRVIIHPRIGTQMYKGGVDLEACEAAMGLSTHRLVYNGDIRDLASFEALRLRFPGVEEWMIGRWALFDPFLPGLIHGLPSVADPLAVVRDFHEDVYRGYREVLFGPGHVLDKMKEIWTYLGRNIGGAGPALDALARARTLESYEAAALAILSKGEWLPGNPGETEFAGQIRTGEKRC